MDEKNIFPMATATSNRCGKDDENKSRETNNISASVEATVDMLVSEIELHQHLNSAKNVGDFLMRIGRLLRPIGISDFAHTSMKSMSGVLDPFGTYDPKTTDQYAREGFHTDDMTVRALLRDKRPIFRSVVDNYVAAAPFDTEALARHRDARKFLEQQGMLDVYNVPIVRDNEVISLFSMSTRNCSARDFFAKAAPYADQIQKLAHAVDTIGARKFNSHFHNDKFNPRLPLHQRPLLLLETLAQKGCTLNEAAEVLDIAISTANQHIAAAKKAFGVSTTQGAILAALKEKLIHLD
jgi:autoinducer binding domain-containing protein